LPGLFRGDPEQRVLHHVHLGAGFAQATAQLHLLSHGDALVLRRDRDLGAVDDVHQRSDLLHLAMCGHPLLLVPRRHVAAGPPRACSRPGSETRPAPPEVRTRGTVAWLSTWTRQRPRSACASPAWVAGLSRYPVRDPWSLA